MNIACKSECKASFTNVSDHRQIYLEIYLNSLHNKNHIQFITKTIYINSDPFRNPSKYYLLQIQETKRYTSKHSRIEQKTHKISNSRTFLYPKSTIFFYFYPAIINKLFNSYILYKGQTDTDYMCNLIPFFFVQNYMYFF